MLDPVLGIVFMGAPSYMVICGNRLQKEMRVREWYRC
jgi:hypothetical protein